LRTSTRLIHFQFFYLKCMAFPINTPFDVGVKHWISVETSIFERIHFEHSLAEEKCCQCSSIQTVASGSWQLTSYQPSSGRVFERRMQHRTGQLHAGLPHCSYVSAVVTSGSSASGSGHHSDGQQRAEIERQVRLNDSSKQHVETASLGCTS